MLQKELLTLKRGNRQCASLLLVEEDIDMVWTTVMFIGRPEDGEQCGIQFQLVGVGNHK